MKKMCFVFGVLLLFSICANMLSLVILDRALFYREHIWNQENAYVNEGLYLNDNDKIRRLSNSGVKLGVFIGVNVVRYWVFPTNLPLKIVNRGRVEEKISETLSRFPDTVLAVEADYVIINAGFCEIFTTINAGRDPALVIQKNFQSLQVIVAQARAHGVQPIITTLLPVRPRVLLSYAQLLEYHGKYVAQENEAFAQYNQLIHDFCRQQHLPLVDFHAVLVDEEGQLAREYAGSDGEHLNDAGYEVLNRALLQQLTKIVAASH